MTVFDWWKTQYECTTPALGAALGYDADEICLNCGWRRGQHRSTNQEDCPNQQENTGPTTWDLQTVFVGSGYLRTHALESQVRKDPRFPMTHAAAPTPPQAPTPPPPDPSIHRDAAHKPIPLPERTPYDRFPDLKDWKVTKGGAEDGVERDPDADLALSAKKGWFYVD